MGQENEICVLDANEGGTGVEFVRQLFEGASDVKICGRPGASMAVGLCVGCCRSYGSTYLVLHAACCGVVEGQVGGDVWLGVEKVW